MTKPESSDPGSDAAAPGSEILYGDQTRLAIANFRISGLRFPRALIQALGLIKACAALELERLCAALTSLPDAIVVRAKDYATVVKTGRTHLMDAVPITLGQELCGWAAQVDTDLDRLRDVEQRLLSLAQGGTAVGTGLNAHPELAARFALALSERTGLAFRPAPNAFAAIGAQDTAIELSGLPEGELLDLLDPMRMARPHTRLAESP